METKTYGLEIKQLGEGKVLAALAKIGVRDRDNDVLRKGLVGGHQIVAIKPAHKWDHVNLGVADVYENGDTMEGLMEFNMNIQAAKDWWEAIRFSHEKNHRTQYSFGFEPTDYEHGQHSDGKAARFLNQIALAECSPVLIGASIGSQTLSIKAFDDLPEPETADGELDDLKAAGVRVQSLIFPKDKWDSADAVRSWLSSHDYSTSLDTTGSSWRARQEEPSKFARLRSFCINPGRSASSENCRVMAVGGPMKESRGMDAEHPVIELSQGRWAVGVHVTETESKVWDAGIQLPRIHKQGEPGYFRSIYAAQNPHSDLTQKTSFALPHHFVDADGHAGPASVRACVEGLEVVHRFWGGLLAKEHIEAVKAHLEAHIRDAGREPIQVRSASDGGQYPLDPLIELWCWDGEQLLHRLDSIREIKSKHGQTLSEARLKQLVQMSEIFQTLRTLLSIKHLDQPSDEVLEQLSAEARADALGHRIEQIRAKVQQDSDDREEREIAERVQRWQQHLRVT